MLSTFRMKCSKVIATCFLLSSPSIAAQVGIQDGITPVGKIIPERPLVRREKRKIQGASLFKTEQLARETLLAKVRRERRTLEHYGASAQQEVGTTASLAQMELGRWSQTLQVHSQLLSHEIQAHAESLAPGATHNFLRTFRNCAPCKMYERFGEDNDGGYVMCTDGLHQGLVGAYSLGINGYDGWGMAIASRYRIPLNEYDCTSSKGPAACKGCHVKFRSQCILDQVIADVRASKGEPMASAASFKTLTQMLKESGHANAKDRSLLLKIDVESAEWKVFAEEPIANLKKFREIVVEFHRIQDKDKHDLYLQAVQKIDQAGFAVTHMHGNNMGGPMRVYGNYSIPDVIEVTYIQKPTAGCAANIPYKSLVDMPNSPKLNELPDPVLPANL